MAGVVTAAPATATGPAAIPQGPGAGSVPWLLLMPATAALVLLFVLPIGYVLLLSFTDPQVSLAHYQRIFAVPLYTRILFNTFATSLTVTVICLLLAYPLAYVISRRNDWISLVLLICVAVCFWTGFIVRTYAWLVILGNKGPVAAVWQGLGLGAPPQLLFTSFASTLGMTHILLPYMVLALYSVMKKIDPNLLRAAASLGARPNAAFRAVFLPLSLPGVVNGSILVFTICLGFFVTPILLGTPKDMMISQLVNQQIEELLAWGFASAIAVVLLIATSIVLAIYNRFVGLDRLWG
ncbi:MAG: ABC transporter permease [Alphaproteobacteria bacterium]|nr:ABC transporter permease [Alphaproteobacteria bacterium]